MFHFLLSVNLIVIPFPIVYDLLNIKILYKGAATVTTTD